MKSQCDRFARMCGFFWNTLRYERKHQHGYCSMGSLGVTFHESRTGDSAVVVTLSPIYMKGRAIDVARAIEKIRTIVNNTGL